jgi:predicted nicotinamide N-methyase
MDESPYPLVDVAPRVGGRTWTITAVQDQDALIESVRTDEDLAAFPYGLMLWASAIGLAERIAEQPELVRGKHVLEIGTGVGLPGLVARALGAVRVAQTDYQETALALARRNATQNGLAGLVEHRLADWRDFPPDLLSAFDVVLGSDVLYERTLHDPLADLLPRLIRPGGDDALILVSDPLRPQALAFIEQQERTMPPGWRVDVEGRRACVPGLSGAGAVQDIALFFLRPL